MIIMSVKVVIKETTSIMSFICLKLDNTGNGIVSAWSYSPNLSGECFTLAVDHLRDKRSKASHTLNR